MNIIFRMVIFSLLLNFATGLVQVAVVDVNNTSIFTASSGAGTQPYDSGYADEFNLIISENLTPDSTLTNKGDEIYRVFDLTNLGFIMRWLEIIKNYMYGFVVFMQGVFGGMLGPTTSKFLFGVPFGLFANIINIGYGIAGFMLLTGKNINES